MWSKIHSPPLAPPTLPPTYPPWAPPHTSSPRWTLKSLMSKRCVKSPIVVKSFLCIFTLLRGQEPHKRRMEMRMKRVRHERHILLGFEKGGRRQWLLYLLLLFSFFLIRNLRKKKKFLAPFEVVFLHSCCCLSSVIVFLSSWPGWDHKPVNVQRGLLTHTHTH